MTVYTRGTIMNENRRVVSELLAERPNDLFDLDLYLEALANEEQRSKEGRRLLLSASEERFLTEYIEFLRQLGKTFTGCSFTVDGLYDPPYPHAPSYDDMANKLYEAFRDKIHSQKIFVYVPTNRYTSGWVGFGDFRLSVFNRAYVPRIGVWSEHISNYNTSNQNMQHSLKTTTSAPRALRVATTYFKEEDMSLVALNRIHDARMAIQDDRNAVERLVDKAREHFIDHNAFPAAIEWLVDSGYEFNDKGLEDEMRTYVTELKYQAEVTPSQLYPNIIYVRGYLKDGEQAFDQVRLGATNDLPYEVDQTHQTFGTCKEEDLSEDIKRKLSILMMGEDGSFVARVGYKFDKEVYYVFE